MIDTNNAEGILAPVKKSIIVPLSVEDAYKLFTTGLASWWPLITHSVGEEDTTTCKVEEFEGGKIYETNKDGSEAPWGKVLVWEPPTKFSMTWHPGRDEKTAQRVEVMFEEEGKGTRLELIHHDWELLGDKAEITRNGYDSGWDIVLGKYVSQSEIIRA